MHDADAAVATRPYHHGALRQALLECAEAILEGQGIQALTLRAVARAAGVSHTAPNNHFDDLTGLLSELAAVGFRRFTASLSAAMDQVGEDAAARMKAMGRAYVNFARAYPGLFVLMFRSERLDATRPALVAAIEAARQTQRGAIAARAPGSLSAIEAAGRAAASWSLMHGFAMLLIEGRLEGLIATLPIGDDADSLLERVLSATHVGDDRN